MLTLTDSNPLAQLVSRPGFKAVAACAAVFAVLVAAACAAHDDPVTPVQSAAGNTPVGARAPQAGQSGQSGLMVLTIPDEDPGPPFYARVGLQFLTDGDLLAIPFYRDPACVPADFNLLEMFHFPGPGGPGAFACPLSMTGRLLIEPDAPLGTFPRQVVLQGDAVRFWFVPYADFQEIAEDGVVTMPELAGLSPLQGTAGRYHETLHPREGEHRIVIDAGGLMDDGRRFQFHATHIDDTLRSIRIRIW